MNQGPDKAGYFSFLQGGGEMGELVRTYDWGSTSIGTPDRWPQSLRTVVSIVLHSKFPMFLWWGKDLVQFYNDAYRPGLSDSGMHPDIFGKPGANSWPDSWHIIKPLIDTVLTGESVWNEDLLIPNVRQGQLVDTFWTFGYMPVHDESDEVAGILVSCLETTEKVMSLRDRTRELEEAHGSLLHANKYLQRIINLCKEPMQVLEPVFRDDVITDFRFKLTNAAYAAYANASPEQLQARLVSEVFPGYLETTSFTKVAEIFATGNADTWEIHYDKDGLDLYNMMSASKVDNEVVVHFTDFTKLKHLQLELLDKIQELERSNQQLEEFAHAASHDMKEPIRKIQVFTGQLKKQLRERLDENETNMLARIESATERMGLLIDDLLVYSHVSQRVQEKEPVDLQEKVKRVLEDLELAIHEKRAVITIGELPVIKGNSRQLQQLFQNLVSNAIKYSKKETAPQIKISASVVKKEGKKYHCISISDNGIGFDHQYSEKIFMMFARLHNRSEYGGTGVGLSIVKKVVENHNGYIEVNSAPGEGSAFHIFLPA